MANFTLVVAPLPLHSYPLPHATHKGIRETDMNMTIATRLWILLGQILILFPMYFCFSSPWLCAWHTVTQ